MIEFKSYSNEFALDLERCLYANKIRGVTSKVCYKHPNSYKVFNIVVYTENCAHIIWASASQKERFRAIDRDAILLNTDSQKSEFFRKPFVELWYIGQVGDSQKESIEKAIERMRSYGVKCDGFKDDHVMSVYDTERFSNFIHTLSNS